MATTHPFPPYSGISGNIDRVRIRFREPEFFLIVEGFSQLLLFIQCPRHQWTWPRANKEERVSGFDAHQTCFKCNSRRLFNSKEWRPGPIYRSRDDGGNQGIASPASQNSRAAGQCQVLSDRLLS
jgi:hypothetical protein